MFVTKNECSTEIVALCPMHYRGKRHFCPKELTQAMMKKFANVFAFLHFTR